MHPLSGNGKSINDAKQAALAATSDNFAAAPSACTRAKSPHLAVPQRPREAGPIGQAPFKLPPVSFELERKSRGIARWYDPNIKLDGWLRRHGGPQSAHAYAEGYWRIALRAAQQLVHASDTRLDDMLRAMGSERQALAVQARSLDALQFGVYLGHNPTHRRITTQIVGEYLKLSHVEPFIGRLKRNDITIYGDALICCSGDTPTFTFKEILPDGSPMYLSAIVQDEVGIMDWQHAIFTPERLKHLEHLFTAAQQPPRSRLSNDARLHDVCERVGKLHFFLAHCCPFKRGSAGISDMLITAIMYNHGYHHAGWNVRVSADVVALATPSSAVFAKMYRGLMARGPTLRT